MMLAVEPFSAVASILGGVLRVRMEAAGLRLTREVEGIRAILYKGVVIAEGDIRTIRKQLRELFKHRGDELLKYLAKDKLHRDVLEKKH